MLNHSEAKIEKISVHQIGNKNKEEGILLSKNELDISEKNLEELLTAFFLSSFTSEEYYQFTFSNQDFTLNPLYNFASQIFENKDDFHLNSENIAQQLYEVSNHSQIKSGELFVVYFSNISYDGRATQALGIFKSENKHSFLKVSQHHRDFELHTEDGINPEKLDKGCLILNRFKDEGYKICIVDRANKSAEAQYWKEQFLILKPCNDEYHQTKDFLSIAKNYVTKQLTEEFDINKSEQIDILNRSLDYFKSNDNFDKSDFENQVFQEPSVIESFRKYDTKYRENHEIELEDSFEISPQAVKKQSRIFKSILKLDKNFHVYIHSNRELIEQGVESDGRKFYKIYFEEEH